MPTSCSYSSWNDFNVPICLLVLLIILLSVRLNDSYYRLTISEILLLIHFNVGGVNGYCVYHLFLYFKNSTSSTFCPEWIYMFHNDSQNLQWVFLCTPLTISSSYCGCSIFYETGTEFLTNSQMNSAFRLSTSKVTFLWVYDSLLAQADPWQKLSVCNTQTLITLIT